MMGDPYRPNSVQDALSAINLYSWDRAAHMTILQEEEPTTALRLILENSPEHFAKRVAEEGLKVAQ